MATATVLTRTPTSHAKAQVVDLTLDDDSDDQHGYKPPRKKQRTEHATTNARSRSSGGVTGTVALDNIDRTLFPRIERALRQLPDGVYDKPSMGAEVLSRLVNDASFAALGLGFGSQIPPERETVLTAKTNAIVSEIRNRFLLPTPRIRSSTEIPKPCPPTLPTSPSKLAHRPVSVSRTPSTPALSTPVPLPPYAQIPRSQQLHPQQQSNSPPAPPSPAGQGSPVPLPEHVLEKMVQKAFAGSEQMNGGGQTVPKVKREVQAAHSPQVESDVPIPRRVDTFRPPSVPFSHEVANRSSTPTRPIASRPPTSTPTLTIPAGSERVPRPLTSGFSGVSIPSEGKLSSSHRSSSSASSNTPVPLPSNPASSQSVRAGTARSKNLTSQGKSSKLKISTKRIEDGKRRPFLSARERREIAECIQNQRSMTAPQLASSTIYHIDFTDEEINTIQAVLQSFGSSRLSIDTIKNLPQRMKLAPALSSRLEGRDERDVRNFLEDLPLSDPTRPRHQVSLARDDFLEQQRRRDRRINMLRLDREITGVIKVGAPMSQHSLQTEALKDLSDSMGHTLARFGQCSGDVATMAWVSPRTILCGATSTMDDRTLDHNKQGNLVLYSASTDKLEVFKEHRELRPVKEGENQDFSRDKWLYPSVVASTIDPERNLVYTAAFDKTVKIWNTEGGSASSMSVVGTWPHEGKVNFVAAALNGSGLVATAADVSSEAVRVYAINMQNPSSSRFISLSCPRRDDRETDQWAYWPSTLQWGTAEETRHLLAVGYSPRSRDGDESQIPEDKQRTGAILLWDSRTGRVIPAHANTVANVFEVVWHPTLPQLIVATSKSGLHVTKGVRTQIRIWKQDPDRIHTDQGWHEYKTLDCTAEDINELTVMPNASHHSYITASCTSGEIFVWDTARGDRPIHVLKHGPSIEPFESEEDMKRRDVGVKFTAWGQTADRLFTGSSDGKVNLWNIRKKRPFIRTVMQGEGAIFCGSFSPDKKMLAIGDGPGTVWLLTDPDEYPGSWGKVCKKRHVPIMPDTDDEHDDEENDYPRQRFLDTGELINSENPVVGMVQGPLYHLSGLFDLKSHLNGDKTAPLIPTVERQQQAAIRATPHRRRSLRRLRLDRQFASQTEKLHSKNIMRDFDPERLERSELKALEEDGVEFEAPFEDFTYESN